MLRLLKSGSGTIQDLASCKTSDHKLTEIVKIIKTVVFTGKNVRSFGVHGMHGVYELICG